MCGNSKRSSFWLGDSRMWIYLIGQFLLSVFISRILQLSISKILQTVFFFLPIFTDNRHYWWCLLHMASTVRLIWKASFLLSSWKPWRHYLTSLSCSNLALIHFWEWLCFADLGHHDMYSMCQMSNNILTDLIAIIDMGVLINTDFISNLI